MNARVPKENFDIFRQNLSKDLREGLSPKEISQEYGVSTSTVYYEIKKSFSKEYEILKSLEKAVQKLNIATETLKEYMEEHHNV